VNHAHFEKSSNHRPSPASRRNFLGPRIRELRRAARPRVTQEDLAGRLAALGLVIDRSAVSRIENQERVLTDIEVIAIARALRQPVGEFFSEPKTYPFPRDRDLKVAEPPGDRT
jgi:transcriptional regulator with XRE-family HTH domain